MPKILLAAFSIFVLGLFVMVPYDTAQAQTKAGAYEKMEVGVSPWPGCAALFIAREKDWFREEGLDVSFHTYPSGHLALAEALRGKVDFATEADTPIARAAVESKPVAVVATIAEIKDGILIIARKDRGVSTPFDLAGKTIGVTRGSSAEFFLHIFLTTSYVDPAEVRIVNVDPDHIVESLLNGEVDAVSTWAPQTFILQKKLGENSAVLGDPSIYTMTWNIASSQGFVEGHPDRVKKFLRAVVKANEFIEEHPAEALAITSRHIGAKSPLLKDEWRGYNFTVKLDQSLILNLEDQARWMIKNDGDSDKKPPDFLKLINTDGLKAVLPEAVTIVGR